MVAQELPEQRLEGPHLIHYVIRKTYPQSSYPLAYQIILPHTLDTSNVYATGPRNSVSHLSESSQEVIIDMWHYHIEVRAAIVISNTLGEGVRVDMGKNIFQVGSLLLNLKTI